MKQLRAKSILRSLLGAAVVMLITACSSNPVAPTTPTVPANCTVGGPEKEITMDSGVKYAELLTCTGGKTAKSGDNITVNYVGMLTDGTVFDSSVKSGKPFSLQIGVGQVIKGWDLGIPGMTVGSKRRLIIPPALGYGAQGTGPIPPNATLVFDVELVSIP